MAYSAEDGAPRVVAKGSGVSAEAMIALAREHGLYVHQSTELVKLLMQVDLDHEIPAELYQAVAELLAWLYAMDQGVAQRISNSQNSGSSMR